MITVDIDQCYTRARKDYAKEQSYTGYVAVAKALNALIEELPPDLYFDLYSQLHERFCNYDPERTDQRSYSLSKLEVMFRNKVFLEVLIQYIKERNDNVANTQVAHALKGNRATGAETGSSGSAGSPDPGRERGE